MAIAPYPRQQVVGRVHAHAAPYGDAAEALDWTTSRACRKLKPLVRAILPDPQLVRVGRRAEHESPTPVVFVSGALRAVGLGISSSGPADYLDSMGQLPYFPPTVAGWEGGLSWLNTNTALARFGFIGGRHRQRAERPLRRRSSMYRTRRLRPPSTVLRRGGSSRGCPPARVRRSRTTAGRASIKASKDRIARQVMLRTLMLAGPDATGDVT